MLHPRIETLNSRSSGLTLGLVWIRTLWRPRLDSFKASFDLGPYVKDSFKDSLILATEIVKKRLVLQLSQSKSLKRYWFYKSGNRNRWTNTGFIRKRAPGNRATAHGHRFGVCVSHTRLEILRGTLTSKLFRVLLRPRWIKDPQTNSKSVGFTVSAPKSSPALRRVR